MALHISGLGHGGSMPASPPPELVPLRRALASPLRTPAQSDQLVSEIAAAFDGRIFDATTLPFSALQEIDKPAVWSAIVELARAKGATRFDCFPDTAARMAGLLRPPFDHLAVRQARDELDLTALPPGIGTLTVEPAAATHILLARDLEIHVAPRADAAAVAQSTVTVIGDEGARHSRRLAGSAHSAAAAAAAVAPGAAEHRDLGVDQIAILRISGTWPKGVTRAELGDAAYCLLTPGAPAPARFAMDPPSACAEAVSSAPHGRGTLLVLPRMENGKPVYALDPAIIKACRERGVQIQLQAMGPDEALAAQALSTQLEADLAPAPTVLSGVDIFAAMRDGRFISFAQHSHSDDAIALHDVVRAWKGSPVAVNREAFARLRAAVASDDGAYSAELRKKLESLGPAPTDGEMRLWGDKIVVEWTTRANGVVKDWQSKENQSLDSKRAPDPPSVVPDVPADVGRSFDIPAFPANTKFAGFLMEKHKDKLPFLTLHKVCVDYAKVPALRAQKLQALNRAASNLAPMKARIDAALNGLSEPSAAADAAIGGLAASVRTELEPLYEAFERQGAASASVPRS